MQISKNIKDRLIDALIMAFVFAAALSWRDTFVKVLTEFLPYERSAIWAEVASSAFITAVVVLIVYAVLKTDSAIERNSTMFDDAKKSDSRRYEEAAREAARDEVRRG